MTAGLIHAAERFLFNPVFIIFIIMLFFICCILLAKRKGSPFFRAMLYLCIIFCLLYAAFLLWCTIAFGSNTPKTEPVPYNTVSD